MLISVFNLKGGVGKSSLSYSLCNDLDCYYITNDEINSIIPNIYHKTLESIDDDVLASHNIVFDGGGFYDENIRDILEHSHLIIIPLELDLNSLHSLSKFYNELKKKNKNIIFVVNKVENNKSSKNDLNLIINHLEEEYLVNKEDIYNLPNSKIFKKIFDEEVGIEQLINSSKFNKYTYRNIGNEYLKLLKRINLK